MHVMKDVALLLSQRGASYFQLSDSKWIVGLLAMSSPCWHFHVCYFNPLVVRQHSHIAPFCRIVSSKWYRLHH
jgi:hypothetical protein